MRPRSMVSFVALLAVAGCSEAAGPGAPDAAQLQVSAYVGGTPIETLVVEVTAADLPTPLVFNITRTGDTATGTVLVPPGPGRTFVARAYDANDVVTHEGQKTVDVNPGSNPPLVITLLPQAGTQPIEIYLGPVAIVITPSQVSMTPGDTVRLQAVITGPDGAIIVAAPAWATTDPAIALVGGDGLVTAVAEGEAQIAAMYGGVASFATVQVAGTSSTSCAPGNGQDVVDAVNLSRDTLGLSTLLVDLRLVAAAQAHSEDMLVTGLSHIGSDSSTFADRAIAAGYTNSSYLGEVVAMGYATGNDVVQAWLASPAHADILLNTAARHVGVGFASDSASTTYWTVMVGANDTLDAPADGCHPGS